MFLWGLCFIGVKNANNKLNRIILGFCEKIIYLCTLIKIRNSLNKK